MIKVKNLTKRYGATIAVNNISFDAAASEVLGLDILAQFAEVPLHALPGALCGDAGTECINQDTCNGSGGCTDNGFVAVSTPCGDPTETECSAADGCDGAGA